MSVFGKAVLAVTGNRLVRRTVVGTRPGRALARRFVAGDDLASAEEAADRLQEAGFEVSLDLLGEEVTDPESAELALDAYLSCLDHTSHHGPEVNVSVKLTQLGLSVDPGLAREALTRLATAAARWDTTVTVDMEDSRFTEATISIYESVQREVGNLGLALQAYLHRTPEDLARVIPLGGHIRLCKGAYSEDVSIAIQDRDAIVEAYLGLLETLMAAEGVRPAVATHDGRLIDAARRLASGRPGPWEYQMLYGVRPDVQRSLVAEGWTARIYLPFGSDWYPYLTRRLAERPANLMFFLRAVLGAR